jgi:ATP-dependent Lhr-like helicase
VPPTVAPAEETEEEIQPDGSLIDIGQNLFTTLRGSSNLVFANSWNRVEFFADLLRKMCEEQHLPNEFWPHHGSLSKDLREDAEAAIKDKSRPVSIVCTSTLEMGIDIGSVVSIAQVGVPPSVASMRQRLGRSGRRDGDPAILRIYIQEDELTEKSDPSDCLRSGLVQTIAMVRLLLAKWYEPPPAGGLYLSISLQRIGALFNHFYEWLTRFGACHKIKLKRKITTMKGLAYITSSATRLFIPCITCRDSAILFRLFTYLK